MPIERNGYEPYPPFELTGTEPKQMDPKISEAIATAVREAGQDEALARRLTAWMNAVTSGNEHVTDDDAARHLESIYAATTIEEQDE